MKKEKMVTRTFEEISVQVLVVNTTDRQTYEDFIIIDSCDDKDILDNTKEYYQEYLGKKDVVPVTILSTHRYTVKYAISESMFKLYGKAIS